MKQTVFASLSRIQSAQKRISAVVETTILQKNQQYSDLLNANVLLKREDLHQVRSYKIRGAYNKIAQQNNINYVVCASAGNHAQGVAYTCQKLGIKGTIFMPITTPDQKIQQVKMFGKNAIDIKLTGDTFDQAQQAAQSFCRKKQGLFIPPFDDIDIIEGQATIGLEILAQHPKPIDYLFIPIGGGGLAAGVSHVFKRLCKNTKIIGVEPKNAASMHAALSQGHTVKLSNINNFVDGAAVQQVGELNFLHCRKYLDDVISVDDGLICQTILNLYNKDAIVVEPAGALALAGAYDYQHQLKGKTAVCILSGSNNDITRIEEIREKALLYQGYKHYFIASFPQRAGALKQFVENVLGEQDDITYFQYQKKHNRAHGSAIIGIETGKASDLDILIKKMKAQGFYKDYLNNKPDLLNMLI